jgi:hypothetical protein
MDASNRSINEYPVPVHLQSQESGSAEGCRPLRSSSRAAAGGAPSNEKEQTTQSRVRVQKAI